MNTLMNHNADDQMIAASFKILSALTNEFTYFALFWFNLSIAI